MNIKNFLLACLAIGALLMSSFTSFAAPPEPVNGFTVSSTNLINALSYAIVSPRAPLPGSAPRITYINAGSAAGASFLTFYKVLNQTTVLYTNTTTTIPVNTTNTGDNWQSGTIIIRHHADDTYEKRTLAANTGATNVVVTAAPLGTVLPGDILYYAVTPGAGRIFWGPFTNSLSNPGGIYIGQRDKPLLMEINGTGADASVNLVAGDYVR